MYYCSLPQNNTLTIERGISLNVIWFDFVSVATVEILICLSRFDPALLTRLVLLISELWSRARLLSCYAFKRQLLPDPCGTFVSLSGFPLNLESELCKKYWLQVLLRLIILQIFMKRKSCVETSVGTMCQNQAKQPGGMQKYLRCGLSLSADLLPKGM